MAPALAEMTYVLPIRRDAVPASDDLASYLAELSPRMPVIVVDGSPPEIFARHAAMWPRSIAHVPVDADRARDLNGKVAGVVTGLRRVRTPKAVVADDDVRWDPFALRRLEALLDGAGVVRPQNVFAPAPWHAILDEGRTLIARATGGDWPGTLGLRMDAYARVGGYDGGVLFENLEFVRTLRAAGAREIVAYDLYVARRPPTARHFFSQRLRQAYDELARPGRYAAQLALAPAAALAVRSAGARGALALLCASIALAEAGRRRAGAHRVFPARASLLAPVWVLERAVTSWAALALFARGGVRYSNGRLRRAATPRRVLRARYGARAA
ncbi:MAG TPA: hypothetical protein VFB22_16025 [Candidatus Baltobacteraceae bacterium]|nr:hypothetical protein [Candidatus Baltobacteraceae bacterium]